MLKLFKPSFFLIFLVPLMYECHRFITRPLVSLNFALTLPVTSPKLTNGRLSFGGMYASKTPSEIAEKVYLKTNQKTTYKKNATSTAVQTIRVIPHPCPNWIHDEAMQHEFRMETYNHALFPLDSRAVQLEHFCDHEPKNSKVKVSKHQLTRRHFFSFICVLRLDLCGLDRLMPINRCISSHSMWWWTSRTDNKPMEVTHCASKRLL